MYVEAVQIRECKKCHTFRNIREVNDAVKRYYYGAGTGGDCWRLLVCHMEL